MSGAQVTQIFFTARQILGEIENLQKSLHPQKAGLTNNRLILCYPLVLSDQRTAGLVLMSVISGFLGLDV